MVTAVSGGDSVKQLHLANIANVAYGYGKILRGIGVAADVLCYDLTHVLSLPEWVEGEFEIDVGDEWHPDLARPEVASVRLPTWYRRIRSQDYPAQNAPGTVLDRRWVEAVVHASRRYGPRWEIRPDDVAAFLPLCEVLEAHFLGGYDLIFGYAYGAVPPLLTSLVPYIPVEIGTLRDTVNIDSPLGRLLALSYRMAPHTIITNADCIAAAKALTLENYSYVPHPVDDDIFRPLAPNERVEIRHRLSDSKHLLIAPARQSWDVKANDNYLRAFAELVRSGIDATLLIAEWGPDIARAKALVDEMGVAQFVRWFSPVPERRLAKMFAAADLVLDQFGTFGTFGLIAPKAMSCGTPCLLSFDPQIHSWCFDGTPPLIAARHPSEILRAMQHYLSSPAELERCGSASREWIVKNHGKDVVARKLMRVADNVLSNPGKWVSFNKLRAERQATIRSSKRASKWRTGVSVAAKKFRRLGRAVPAIRETISGLRSLHFDRRRLRGS